MLYRRPVSARGILERAEALFEAEGVTVTRVRGEIVLCLPRSSSSHHLLGMVGVLWEVWTAARDEVMYSNVELTVDVSAFDGNLPLPLISVMSAIGRELDRVGRRIQIADSGRAPAALRS